MKKNKKLKLQEKRNILMEIKTVKRNWGKGRWRDKKHSEKRRWCTCRRYVGPRKKLEATTLLSAISEAHMWQWLDNDKSQWRQFSCCSCWVLWLFGSVCCLVVWCLFLCLFLIFKDIFWNCKSKRHVYIFWWWGLLLVVWLFCLFGFFCGFFCCCLGLVLLLF